MYLWSDERHGLRIGIKPDNSLPATSKLHRERKPDFPESDYNSFPHFETFEIVDVMNSRKPSCKLLSNFTLNLNLATSRRRKDRCSQLTIVFQRRLLRWFEGDRDY